MARMVHSVLAVDDDPAEVDFLCRVVGSEYPVTYATSGNDALHRASAVRPDAIIMDGRIAFATNGFSVLEELQKNPECRNIPVIILMDTERAESNSRRFDLIPVNGRKPAAVLDKPVRPDELLGALRQAMGGDRGFCHRSTMIPFPLSNAVGPDYPSSNAI